MLLECSVWLDLRPIKGDSLTVHQRRTGGRLSYSAFYDTCLDAVANLHSGTPIPANEILDWIASQRGNVIKQLQQRGYGEPGACEGWSWRQYLGNALSRMAREGLLQGGPKIAIDDGGAIARVATWSPGVKTYDRDDRDERQAFTIRLPQTLLKQLRQTAEGKGVSLQSIVESTLTKEVTTDVLSRRTRAPDQLPLIPDRDRARHAFEPDACQPTRSPMTVAGLFAGIGGFELGLSRAGHTAELLCEIEPGARAVLGRHFPGIRLHDDVRTLEDLPVGTELLVGGFPCQDLSQAGQTRGIKGARSGLVGEVFRLLEKRPVPWLLLENVPFMLQLGGGEALEVIVSMFEHFGYKWAYRVVDTRAFGLPQRRKRVLMLASLDEDPRTVLLADDADEPEEADRATWRQRACGFYWTEGVRGLGWADDAIPTLKPGSTVGIPSPPAVVMPDGRVVKPELRDAERLQGFEVDWTLASEAELRRGHRWKLVGNAVTVDVAEWLGRRLRCPAHYDDHGDSPLERIRSWPIAGYNVAGQRMQANVTTWPAALPRLPLSNFLRFEPEPLSARATEGFLNRTTKSSLRFPSGFIALLREHLAKAKGGAEAA